MFDIPMNSKGAMSLTDLASTTGSPQQQQMQQPQMQQQMQQPQMQQPQMQQQMQQPQMQQQMQQPQMQQQMQQPQMQQQMQQPQMQQPQMQQSTGVSLAKGQRVSLSKMNPNLSAITVGLGWDVSGAQIDLDTEAFILGANDRVLGDDWFVFYNQLASPDGAVRHSGDNTTGIGAGDDETININLNQLNPQADKITFVVTISSEGNFSQVSNAYIRVVDSATGAELVRFNLTDYYQNVRSMMVGDLYKKDGQWRFNAIGEGTGDDLAGLCTRYGVNLA